MKYIYAGYPKTGTKTIASVFKLLGYNVYDLEEQMIFQAHEWIKIMDPHTTEPQKRDLLYTMYKDVDVVSDHPACLYWELLLSIFPEAKVIFYERDVDTWWTSIENTVKMYQKAAYSYPDWLVKPFRWYFIPSHYYSNHMLELCCKYIYGYTGYGLDWRFQYMPLDEFTMRRFYLGHNGHVMRTCPKDKLFVLTKDSWDWKSICGLIGNDVPKDIPFPHENKQGAIVENLLHGLNRKNQDNLRNRCEKEWRRGMMGVVVASACAVGGIAKYKPGMFETVVKTIESMLGMG